jgi:hypothetical protein
LARTPRTLFFIVEGTDNSGKTTLVQRLEALYRIPSIHSLGPSSLEDATAWLLEIVGKAQRQSTILDRFSLFSEAVYGPILRGRSVYDGHGELTSALYKLLVALRPVIIYCVPPLGTVTRNLHEREQMAGVVENTEKLYDGYNRFFHTQLPPDLPVRYYDWTLDPEAKDLFQKVLERDIQERILVLRR